MLCLFLRPHSTKNNEIVMCKETSDDRSPVVCFCHFV